MLFTILAGLFLLAGLVCAFLVPLGISKHAPATRSSSYDNSLDVNGRLLARSLGVAGITIGLLVFLLAGITSVPVKNVGVVTSFGHVEGDLQPGFHWLAPWKDTTNLSETIQTTEFYGTGKLGNCLDVRIGGQQLACLNVTVQWQIRDSAAPALFNDYDTSGNVQGQITDAVVIQELKAVVNQVMGDYNPIQDVAANTASGNSQFSTFGPKILTQMRADIGSQIDVRKLILSNAYYDSATQARLNAIQQQYADTAIAQEQLLTNEAQARANAALSRNLSPEVLQADCQNLILTAIKDNYTGLPATLCSDSGSVVSVGSGK
jgi:regulator of protease activity HflC (stomatin/prohibitin superfamily)